MTPPANGVLQQGVHRDLGLTDDEFESIKQDLGRDPTFTELAMFSVMWSEHCSYKSSRVHLRSLPTEGPHIVVGPGEGAGIVEVAPGTLVAWKVESHNHPSFVEPFNGAATGVGGIVRDILSMGARPIALLDSLRFGPLTDARNRYLIDGVVHGISAYGNSIGVPTVGGETVFDDCYSANPLVNAACLGVVEDKLIQSSARGTGNKLILFGSGTGRDGIGGASVLASAEFDDTSLDKRPSVQVGDPLTEKLLIEASLELIRRDLIVGFQDLGAGGISCPTSEMPAKTGAGVVVDPTRVHLREPDMRTFEIMISESQERMLAVAEPNRVPDVLEVCAKWGLDASVIGEVTDTGRLEVVAGDGADVPVAALAEQAPVYDRPATRPTWIDELQSAEPGDSPPPDIEKAFLTLLTSPSIASKRWVWQQYDHMLFLGTVLGPGGDAAVVRLPGTQTAVAVSLDGPGRFCYLDPYEGARLAVAESARNVACTGARPLAVTNCLNFGNPEKPEVMWQFAEAVRGIGDACRALGTPVTGGNVSFYNETDGRAVYPTPVIGMLGALDRAEKAVGMAFVEDGDIAFLLGETNPGDFGGSEYAKVINDVVAGRPPRLDLSAETRLIGLLVRLAADGVTRSAHDVADGGLAVAIAEAAVSGGHGLRLSPDFNVDHVALFAESPSRAVITCAEGDEDLVVGAADAAGVPVVRLGTVGGDRIDLGSFEISVEDAIRLYEDALLAALSTRL
ncbi:MAG: phosphoribosylformylglycinamidine synthase subunit PurL [Actinomycetota bacterium]|nr:phosphoribosylformylglycinamidine synthase subunit PurL [Actinomycetota bacterium]